jgi:hypothetical protein
VQELFNVNFNANLKLFLILSNCASVGEKTSIRVKGCLLTKLEKWKTVTAASLRKNLSFSSNIMQLDQPECFSIFVPTTTQLLSKWGTTGHNPTLVQIGHYWSQPNSCPNRALLATEEIRKKSKNANVWEW